MFIRAMSAISEIFALAPRSCLQRMSQNSSRTLRCLYLYVGSRYIGGGSAGQKRPEKFGLAQSATLTPRCHSRREDLGVPRCVEQDPRDLCIVRRVGLLVPNA